MERNFTIGRPKPPWKLEETEIGHLKFGSVCVLYSGVLALVESGCGDLHAAVTGCSLRWLNALVSRCRARLTVFGAEAAGSWQVVVTVLAAICVGDLGVGRSIKKTEMKGET